MMADTSSKQYIAYTILSIYHISLAYHYSLKKQITCPSLPIQVSQYNTYPILSINKNIYIYHMSHSLKKYKTCTVLSRYKYNISHIYLKKQSQYITYRCQTDRGPPLSDHTDQRGPLLSDQTDQRSED